MRWRTSGSKGLSSIIRALMLKKITPADNPSYTYEYEKVARVGGSEAALASCEPFEPGQKGWRGAF